MAKVTVVMDPQDVARFARDGNGPIVRYGSKIANQVKRGAQRRVGVYQPKAGDPFAARRVARRRPGTLRDSIVTRVVNRGGLPVFIVLADDPIAEIHHEGTDPHFIRPRKASRLVFYNGTNVVATTLVRHPGTQPNRFLTSALRDVR